MVPVMFLTMAAGTIMVAAITDPSTVDMATFTALPMSTATWTLMALPMDMAKLTGTITTAMVSTISFPICSKARSASSMPRRCPSWESSRF